MELGMNIERGGKYEACHSGFHRGLLDFRRSFFVAFCHGTNLCHTICASIEPERRFAVRHYQSFRRKSD
jgi:hypothetical protein